MNKNTWRRGIAICAAVLVWTAAAPAQACQSQKLVVAGAAEPETGHSAVMAAALRQLRHERGRTLQKESRVRLAELRSEAASAVAQGSIVGDSATVSASP